MKFFNTLTPQPKKFKDAITGDEHGMIYTFGYVPYTCGEDYGKILVEIQPDIKLVTKEDVDKCLTSSSFCDHYPEVIKIVDILKTECNGELLKPANVPPMIMFKFTSKVDLFVTIKLVSQILLHHGIAPNKRVVRSVAFPSIEYATDYLSYVTKSDCSMLEVDAYIAECAGCRGEVFEEGSPIRELPCVSKQKFDPQNSTDPTEVLDCIEDLVASKSQGVSVVDEFIKQLLIKSYPMIPEEPIKSELPEQGKVSDKYQQFTEMYY